MAANVSNAAAEAGKPTYAASSYWDTRYNGPIKSFDWFYNYPALKELLHTYLPCGKVLHVGCGNSNMQAGMAADGFTVVNVDISPVVIEQMKLQHAGNNSLDYIVADCRDMSELETGTFQSCVDKGTLDAVLCSQSGQGDVVKYVHEVGRLLQPGGIFLLISLGAPAARLSLLQKEMWGKVEVLLLPKPMLYLQSEASSSGRPLPAHCAADKNEPIRALGPWPAAATHDELAAQQLDPRDYFFAYICRKSGAEKGGQEGPDGAERAVVGGGSAEGPKPGPASGDGGLGVVGVGQAAAGEEGCADVVPGEVVLGGKESGVGADLGVDLGPGAGLSLVVKRQGRTETPEEAGEEEVVTATGDEEWRAAEAEGPQRQQQQSCRRAVEVECMVPSPPAPPPPSTPQRSLSLPLSPPLLQGLLGPALVPSVPEIVV